MLRSPKVQKLMDLARRVEAQLARNPNPPPPNMTDPRPKWRAYEAERAQRDASIDDEPTE